MSELNLLSQTELPADQRQNFELSRSAAVLNTTDSGSLFSAANLSKFRDGVPKQAWSLCLSSAAGQAHTVPIAEMERPDQREPTTGFVSSALLTAQAADLKKLPQLLVPGCGGVKVLGHP